MGLESMAGVWISLYFEQRTVWVLVFVPFPASWTICFRLSRPQRLCIRIFVHFLSDTVVSPRGLSPHPNRAPRIRQGIMMRSVAWNKAGKGPATLFRWREETDRAGRWEDRGIGLGLSLQNTPISEFWPNQSVDHNASDRGYSLGLLSLVTISFWNECG
jgi:hypothetical protein